MKRGDYSAAILGQIKLAANQNITELKHKFEELYGFSSGSTTSRNLRKRIAYRIQEIYLGGVSDGDMEILNSIADKDRLANLDQRGVPKVTTRAGTRLLRVWKGVEYEVVSCGNGEFEFQGERFKSLSAIARKITGTRWNGKLFFGVNKHGR